MSGNFSGGSFSGALGGFSVDAAQAAMAEIVTGGKGDNAKRRIIKPLGILHLPKKKNKEIQDRVEDSRQIQYEIAERLAREFTEENVSRETLTKQKSPIRMSMVEIDAEIKVLLQRKIITEDEELMLLLLLAAAA